MRILYRNPENQSLSVTDVTNTQYIDEAKLLVFFGGEDICIHAGQEQADLLTKTLFEKKKLDLTSYGCVFYEWPDDEDEEDDDDFSPFDGSDFVVEI